MISGKKIILSDGNNGVGRQGDECQTPCPCRIFNKSMIIAIVLACIFPSLIDLHKKRFAHKFICHNEKKYGISCSEFTKMHNIKESIDYYRNCKM